MAPMQLRVALYGSGRQALCGKTVCIDDSFSKGLRSFLRQIESDATNHDSVRIGAGAGTPAEDGAARAARVKGTFRAAPNHDDWRLRRLPSGSGRSTW